MLALYIKHRAVCAPWEATIGLAMQLADRLPVPSVAVLATAVLTVVCVPPTSTVELAVAAPPYAAAIALTSSRRNQLARTMP